MDTLNYIIANWPLILSRTGEHVSIVGVAVGLAILTGVPIGIAITQNQRAADAVLYIASIVITIPSIALFGMMIPVLSLIGHGIGYLPAVIAVLLYSQLPIIRNTYTAIHNVDPALREAARGMGLTRFQRLREVEMPIAVPVIMSGVRVAVVMNIGVTAIAAYIGAGGLGAFISRGISQTDPRQLITGALAVSILAVVADFALLGLQRLLTSPGLETGMIRLERVTKVFPGSSVPAVDQVTMEVPAGEICVLLGPSGLRQDDDHEDGQPADRADLGRDLHRRQEHHRSEPGRAPPHARLRHPADRPVPQQDHRGQHLRRPRHPRLGQGEVAQARRRAARHGRARPVDLPQALSRRSCPAASSSASACFAPSPTTRRCCSWTSPSAPSTRSTGRSSRTSS